MIYKDHGTLGGTRRPRKPRNGECAGPASEMGTRCPWDRMERPVLDQPSSHGQIQSLQTRVPPGALLRPGSPSAHSAGGWADSRCPASSPPLPRLSCPVPVLSEVGTGPTPLAAALRGQPPASPRVCSPAGRIIKGPSGLGLWVCL